MPKAKCGVCLGEHFTAECPRRVRKPAEPIILERYAPPCPHCPAHLATIARLEAENRALRAALPKPVTETPAVTKSGRPRSGNALTAAEKQRRYRERRVG